jgi:hypothetical protein
MVVFKFGNSFEKGSGLDGTRVPHHKLHAWAQDTNDKKQKVDEKHKMSRSWKQVFDRRQAGQFPDTQNERSFP